MPRSPALVPWANDANYAAGADPWSGTPTKVSPAAPEQAKGMTPNTEAQIQKLNCQISALTAIVRGLHKSLNLRSVGAPGHTAVAAAGYARTAGMGSNMSSPGSNLGARTLWTYSYLAADGALAGSVRRIQTTLLGSDTPSAAWVAVTTGVMNLNDFIRDIAISPTGAGNQDIAIVAVVDAANSGGRMLRSVNGAAWAVVTSYTAGGYGSVAYSPTLDLFAAIKTDGLIATSPGTDGNTWTTRRALIGAYTLAPSYKMLRWNGVAARFGSIHNTTFATSSDGLSWTARTNPAPGGYVMQQLDFCPVTGDWYLLCGNSQGATSTGAGLRKVYRSIDDGVTWEDITPASTIVNTFHVHEMIIGGTFAVLLGIETFEFGTRLRGLVSFDGGTSWQWERLGNGGTGFRYNAADRLYGGQVFLSSFYGGTEQHAALGERYCGGQ